jgi:SSS family solute:Na+ symporter/cation/acetate symporter
VKTLPIVIVLVLVAITLALTFYAARRTRDTGDHYVAGRRISGWQNGLALAGDQISAASFLGITGAVALTGFGGFYLALGLPTAYLLVLILIAGPLRNLGRYTLADVVVTRFESRGLRAAIAVATLVMTAIYMLVQFVGSGLVAGALLDVDFSVAVVILGGLMITYTVLGGMVATTYIQIFKTSLLS